MNLALTQKDLGKEIGIEHSSNASLESRLALEELLTYFSLIINYFSKIHDLDRSIKAKKRNYFKGSETVK